MSIYNQLNLAFLVLRLTHLTLNITGSSTSSSGIDNALCKAANYLLTVSTRIIYWLGALIAIERVYVTLFLHGRWLNKPQIARRLIAVAVVGTLVLSAYQIVFVHSRVSSDDEHNAMCTISFPANRPVWLQLHGVVVIINSVVPFVINLLCTGAIICIVTRAKMNATGGRGTRK